jgi:heterodisulfide reductase subunit A-like polyferredoxin
MSVRTRSRRLPLPLAAPLPTDATRVRLMARGVVIAEPGRCVQCGICSHNCPNGIDVRAYAREGAAVSDRRCLMCGSCVSRCPRGTLRFQLLEAAP